MGQTDCAGLNKMKKYILTLSTAFLVSQCFAGTNGGMAGAFSRMGAGARAKGLGGAFTGVGQGAAAVYFNPGALPFGEEREFTANLSRLALDRTLHYLAFAAPVRPKAGPDKRVVNAGIGLAWLHAGVSDIDARDFDGLPMDQIDQSSNLFMMGFGVQVLDKVGLGVTAKINYDTYGRIGDGNASIHGNGFGADAGVFAKPVDRLTVGAQIKDIGVKTTWSTVDYWDQGSSKADKWPAQYRVGGAYQYSWLLGAVDIESSQESETRLHAGIEAARDITSKQSIAGRVGYDGGAFNFGLGMGFAYWKVRSSLDLVYTLENIAPNDATTLGWSIKF
jgi:hypothetical protein